MIVVKTPKGVAPVLFKNHQHHSTSMSPGPNISKCVLKMPWNPLRNIASVCLSSSKLVTGTGFQAVPNFHDSMSETILRPWSLYSLLRDSALIINGSDLCVKGAGMSQFQKV